MKCVEIQDKFYKYLQKELEIISKKSIYIIRDILKLYTQDNQLKKLNIIWLFEHGIINNVPHIQKEFKEEINKIKEFIKNINYEWI